jgi:hypothetical protein
MTVLRRHNRVCVVILALVAIAMLAGAQIALASFTHTATGGPLTVASSTLLPATGVNASQVNCRANKTPEIEVTWSATSSSYATSYTIERATASSGPYTSVGSVAIGKQSYTDSSGSLAYSTTYYYRVSVVYRSWNTTSPVASVKTLSKYCLSS